MRISANFIRSTEPMKKKEGIRNTTSSAINDHAFIPKGEWYTLCGHPKSDGKICNLAESAHTETTLKPFYYVGNDYMDDE